MCQYCLPFMHRPLVANQKARWSIKGEEYANKQLNVKEKEREKRTTEEEYQERDMRRNNWMREKERKNGNK